MAPASCANFRLDVPADTAPKAAVRIEIPTGVSAAAAYAVKQADEKCAAVLDLLTIATDPNKFNFSKDFNYVDSDGKQCHIKTAEYSVISHVVSGRFKFSGKDGIAGIQKILSNERLMHFIRKHPGTTRESRRCSFFSARLLEAREELKLAHGRNVEEAQKKDGKVFIWYDSLMEIKTFRRNIVDLYGKLHLPQAAHWEVENMMDIALSRAKKDLIDLKIRDRAGRSKAKKAKTVQEVNREEQRQEQKGMRQQQRLPALNGPAVEVAIRIKQK